MTEFKHGEWYPIEDAPKQFCDFVLGRFVFGKTVLVHTPDGVKTVDVNPRVWVDIGYYFEEDDRFCTVCGYEEIEGNETTHFQLLSNPNPPEDL